MSAGATGGTWITRVSRRTAEVSKPPASSTVRVSRSQWQPPATNGHHGAHARWSRPAGDAWCELRIAADGPVVEVQIGRTAGAGEPVQLTFGGPVSPTPTAHLVDGYDSWSYAGVRPWAGKMVAPILTRLSRIRPV